MNPFSALTIMLWTINCAQARKKKASNEDFDFNSLLSGLDKSERKMFKEELFNEVKKFRELQVLFSHFNNFFNLKCLIQYYPIIPSFKISLA